MHVKLNMHISQINTGGRFNIQMLSYQYMNFHYKDKTVIIAVPVKI